MAALCVLFGTTLFWSIKAALVYQYNADQIADPYLFTNGSTFINSIFPSQHSFLLKWPLFLIVALFHNSSIALITITVLVSLITVAALALLIAKIEKRPVIRALIYLALSSALLGTAIEPTPGSLLPIGIGMLTTRNIEYIVFLLATLLIIKNGLLKIRKRRYDLVGLSLLFLLIASDQLFVPLAFGGSLFLLLFGWVKKSSTIRTIGIRVFVVSLIAFVAALTVSVILQHFGIFASTSGAVASPYSLLASPKELVLASIYGILGILSVFGANPIISTVSARDLPIALFQSFQSLSIVNSIVNLSLFCVAVWGSWYIIRVLSSKPKKKTRKKQKLPSIWHIYATYLVASCLTALFVFMATKHYYAVDARYLSLWFFTGFIVIAVFVAGKTFSKRLITTSAIVLLISCGIGLYSFTLSYTQSIKAYESNSSENALITSALQHHQVRTFAADYWRVYPIVQGLKVKSTMPNPLPMDSCTQPRNVLTSKIWQKDAFSGSFAYLLTTNQTGTGYPGCSLATIKSTWGSPSDSLVISGTAAKPKTLLLFYDNGKNNRTTVYKNFSPESLLRNFSSLKDTACPSGQTVVQTIAHQDDDILFMNPDLLHSIKKGDCIRTIYFTAGDAGIDQTYWLGREEGAKAAYASLLGIKQPEWRSRDILLDSGHQVKASQLLSVQGRITLFFIRLPDGNVDGSGFKAHENQSLHKLDTNALTQVKSVDGTSTYTKAQLEDTVVTFLNHYQPSLVRTQAVHNHSNKYPDHSDHIVVGQVTERAFLRYKQEHEDSTILHYIGYPIRERPENVSGEDLRIKRDVFYTFAQHDTATCSNYEACLHTAYTYYLDRQYTE